MAVNVRRGDLDQLLLMPVSMREWLPADHLAFFVLDVVDELDLGKFYAAHRLDGRGGAVYDPAMMLGVLLYAYCTGERSSRRVERRLVEDVAFRVLAGNLRPDHATLARFRRRHQGAIAELFEQVLALCVRAGLVRTEVVAVDGTKIAADASFFANRDRKALVEELAALEMAADEASGQPGQGDRLQAAARRAARQILAEAEEVDAAEDAEQADRERRGEDGNAGHAAAPSRWAPGRDRRDRIRAALDELNSRKDNDFESRMAQRAVKEARLGRKLTGPTPKPDTARRPGAQKVNLTDPDSRVIGQANKGVLQGYNAQTAATVDHIVLAAEVTATTNDQPHFIPIAAAVNTNLVRAGHSDPVGTLLADAGYWTAENAVADVAAQVLIPPRKPSWTKAPKPDDDKLVVLAKVNRGELSQRKAGEILGVSYSWVNSMTKRYFGKDGQRLSTRTAEPEPAEWIPVIEQVARGKLSKRAAQVQLTVSAQRVNTMLAHVRGQQTDPAIVRKAMQDKLSDPETAEIYKKRAATIEPVFGNVKANLGYRRFTRRGLPAVHSEWRLICTAHNLLKLRNATPAPA